MGKTYERIDDRVRQWMDRQHMFFVGTAPLAKDGFVNLSPKGHDALRVIDDRTLVYLDYGGSGVETIAHVRENRRIVIMMCAFEGPPQIMRFHGVGEVVTPIDDDFDELADLFDLPGLGVRAFIKVHLRRISDSCGYGVPNYEFRGQRASSANWLGKKGADGVRDYQVENNLQSLDGIDAISEEEARAYVLFEESDKRQPS